MEFSIVLCVNSILLYIVSLLYFSCLSTGQISEEDKQDYADQLRDVRDSLQAVGFSRDVRILCTSYKCIGDNT